MLLQLKNINFTYPKSKPLFRDLNLDLEENKIYCLLGESGSGKSSLLHLIYGLLNWQEGEVFFEKKKLLGSKNNLVPGEKNMKLVAQKPDLMPYASVSENVGAVLSNTLLNKKKEEITKLLELVGMQDFANSLPKNLSGGQLQRVALAKSLALKPKLLLLDEAFSALDGNRKTYLRDALLDFAKIHKITLLIATHQLQDWLAWTDEILVMRKGEIIEKNKPKNIFETPKNDQIAVLLGEVNFFNPQQQAFLNLPTRYVYPNQFQISDLGFEVEITTSQFSGFYYRNKAYWGTKMIVFYSTIPLKGKIKLIYSKF